MKEKISALRKKKNMLQKVYDLCDTKKDKNKYKKEIDSIELQINELKKDIEKAKTISLRLSENEYYSLKEAASIKEMSISNYIRTKLAEGDFK